jgi:hypothetical protein
MSAMGGERTLQEGERRKQKFKSQALARGVLTNHAAFQTTFNSQRHLFRRPTLRLFRAETASVWAAAVA